MTLSVTGVYDFILLRKRSQKSRVLGPLHFSSMRKLLVKFGILNNQRNYESHSTGTPQVATLNSSNLLNTVNVFLYNFHDENVYIAITHICVNINHMLSSAATTPLC